MAVKRAERIHYLNTGTVSTPVWSPIGEGFTEFKETKNPVSVSRRYIHETTKRTDVTGYSPEIDYEFEVCTSGAAIARLRAITDSELVGDGARVTVLNVDLFDETTTAGVYRAVRRDYTVIPDECGSGTDTLVYTGMLRAAGDAVHGEFVKSTGTFVPDN